MRVPSLPQLGRRLRTIAQEFAGSGPIHRRRLSDIGIRISVTGVRGKSTAVQWLHDILHDRDYDTYAKVTGVAPTSIYNGTRHEIERPAKVRLYENERQLRQFENVDAAVVENQGIRGYTTRLVNEQFVRPHVVFLTNVREDHMDTLGANRLQIARSLARSIPAGTHVISGERDQPLRDYLEAELDRRDATITHVRVPEENQDIPGAEIVYGLNPVLQAVDEPPLEEEKLMSYLDRMHVAWTHLSNGRVFNAAAANDVQSTELIRRRLVAGDGDVVQPLLYLREDRRGRTARFLDYLDALADRGAIAQARVVGQDATLFDRHASFPAVVHDEDTESPADVLEAALADDWPVLVMGNTVSEFMQELLSIIESKAETDAETGVAQTSL
ncbi:MULTISPECIES: Mur ligase family protein [Salinibaculum]|uniref:Mur ligase family protein n=1 Tax=Salinibaculum TaxID=2732368 RepID=UPI0030D26DB6